MAELKEGDVAPQFTANDQHGNSVSLSDFAGQTVILYFYPKDDTPGCTAEACNFRDNYHRLQQEGYVVLGISTDDEKSHKKFSTKYELPFTLLADEDKQIVEAYGVWVEKKIFGNIKHNHGFKRFMLRGKEKVAIEWGLIAIAQNIRKKAA